MLNNEKTIRFEDFAAVSQDGGDVLGKVLYYSLSSILIDRDELESLCDAVGFPKGRSNRTAMGDAFRSATGDIYERRVVKTDSGPQIFKVYCRDTLMERQGKYTQMWNSYMESISWKIRAGKGGAIE